MLNQTPRASPVILSETFNIVPPNTLILYV